MKRHLRLSTTDSQTGADHAAASGIAQMVGSAPQSAQLTLVRTRPWTHTLVLRGRLDEDSAPELEDEIECLREEGVASLTLDLRQLDAIDADVIAVITRQKASFRRCGRHFAVLPAAALSRRGVASESAEVLVHPVASRRPPGHWEVSTSMVRDLGSA